MSIEKREPTSLEMLQSLTETPAPTAPRATMPVGLVATTLSISPATVWRYTRTLPDFPQPERYRSAGRNVTVWYADEVDAWANKHADLAWRTGKPSASHNAEIIDMGNRALWCSWLLQLDPFEIWSGLTPDPSPEGTEAMWHYVAGLVERLLREAPSANMNSRGYPATPEDVAIVGYLRTIQHCRRVMDNYEPPEIRGVLGFTNAGDYQRGIYTRNQGGK